MAAVDPKLNVTGAEMLFSALTTIPGKLAGVVSWNRIGVQHVGAVRELRNQKLLPADDETVGRQQTWRSQGLLPIERLAALGAVGDDDVRRPNEIVVGRLHVHLAFARKEHETG